MTVSQMLIWIGISFLEMALVIFFAGEILDLYDKRKRNYISFNRSHPVGSCFTTKLGEQKFPYGKWLLIGKDQHDFYIYERIK